MDIQKQVMFCRAVPVDAQRVVPWMAEFYRLDGLDFATARGHLAVGRLIFDAALGEVRIIEAQRDGIGYLALTFGYSLECGGRDAFVDELFLEEPHWGRGIGTRALEFASARSQSLGNRALRLEVMHHNRRVHALYRRLGFETHDRLLMTRALARE